MSSLTQLPADDLVTLEPAGPTNVDLLIEWTLDPVAQGPHKRVPEMTAPELRELFLHSSDRHDFLIRRTKDGKPLGRFYFRSWRFDPGGRAVDWELNILIAEPADRGRGYGTAVQRLVLDHLRTFPETRTVFAYTFAANQAERRALVKAGFREVGPLPDPHYRVKLPPVEAILFVAQGKDDREQLKA